MLTHPEVERLSKRQLTQADIEYFRKRFGKRFIRALRTVEEKRVTKYDFRPSETSTWIVQGKRREYLVIPDVYCTCRSFYQSVVIAREVDTCYHLLAQKIAEIRGLHTIVESTDTKRRRMFVKWKRTD